jgi:hypothetical protein
VIQSLFISVIEDGYVTAKYTSNVDMFFGEGNKKVPLKELLRDR